MSLEFHSHIGRTLRIAFLIAMLASCSIASAQYATPGYQGVNGQPHSQVAYSSPQAQVHSGHVYDARAYPDSVVYPDSVAYSDANFYSGGTDPLASIESRLDAMQYQIDTASTIGNCAGCGECCSDGCGRRSRRCGRRDCCDQGQRKPGCGLYFGAAVVYAKPHLKEAFQHSQTNTQTGLQTLIPFEYDYDDSIRGHVGFRTRNGFGIRGTYWGFDADGQPSTNTADGINVYGAHAVNIIFPANIFAQLPGETMTNADSLETKVYNVYATYDTKVGSFHFGGGVGLRHARLEQTLNSAVISPQGMPFRQLAWQRNYEGLGPALTVDVRRRIGQSPFSIFASGGGSLLFGKKSLNRTVLGDQSPIPNTPFLSITDSDEVVGIGEVNFGCECARQLGCGKTIALRGFYEGQLWAEAGAPTLGFLGFEGFGASVELRR